MGKIYMNKIFKMFNRSFSWSQIESLYLMHNPDVSVVTVNSDKFNIYYLLDALHTKGWHLNGLQTPAG